MGIGGGFGWLGDFCASSFKPSELLILGLTGKRLVMARLSGFGVSTAPSLVSPPDSTSIGVIVGCNSFRYLLISAVTAISFSFSVISREAASASFASITFFNLKRKGFS